MVAPELKRAGGRSSLWTSGIDGRAELSQGDVERVEEPSERSSKSG
jgi:hypothetical protein